jgi:hypothetical protein
MPIRQARRTGRISIASPTDFITENAISIRCEQPVPYCLDFLHHRALYVCGIDVQALKAAPFYYLYLRRTARSVLSVPREHGCLSSSAAGSNPIFVFSPGRCGSTLLSQLLFEARVTSVSEPDFYTQMSSIFWSSKYNPLREPFRRAMWSMTDDLCAVLGDVPVIKLRAECCRAPDLLLRQPGARTVMLLRSFETWARSTARAFAPSPGTSVTKFMRALRCYAFLRDNSSCLPLRYETLIDEPQTFCRHLAGFLGKAIPPDAASRALARNSQKGTPLAERVRPGWEAKFDATMRLWHSPRLVSARARLGIPALWD